MLPIIRDALARLAEGLAVPGAVLLFLALMGLAA